MRSTIGAFVVLAFLPWGVRADEAEDVKRIVDKAVKAVGGEDKLLRLFRWKEKGVIGAANNYSREAVLQPPEHWWQNGTDIAKGNKDRTQKTYLVWAFTLVPLLDKDSKLTLLKEIKVADRAAAGVKLARTGQLEISLYFDQETGLLARLDWKDMEVFFSDWKETDGVKYPSKAVVMRGGKQHVKTEFLEFERLQKLPDNIKP